MREQKVARTAVSRGEKKEGSRRTLTDRKPEGTKRLDTDLHRLGDTRNLSIGHRAHNGNENPLRSLDREGTAATASTLYVRVIELESRTFERFDVVDRHTFEIHLAHLVDQNLQSFELVDIVAIFIDLVLKGHVIAEA